MKKKILSLVLIAGMSFGVLTGCGKDAGGADTAFEDIGFEKNTNSGLVYYRPETSRNKISDTEEQIIIIECEKKNSELIDTNITKSTYESIFKKHFSSTVYESEDGSTTAKEEYPIQVNANGLYVFCKASDYPDFFGATEIGSDNIRRGATVEGLHGATSFSEAEEIFNNWLEIDDGYSPKDGYFLEHGSSKVYDMYILVDGTKDVYSIKILEEHTSQSEDINRDFVFTEDMIKKYIKTLEYVG